MPTSHYVPSEFLIQNGLDWNAARILSGMSKTAAPDHNEGLGCDREDQVVSDDGETSAGVIDESKIPSTNSDSDEVGKSDSGKDAAAKATRVRKIFPEWIQDLTAFKAKHGHMNVSEKEDRDLSIFCRRMRYARRNPTKTRTLVSQDRIDALDKLSFDWDHRSYIPFEDRVAALRDYKEEHGHLNVSDKEDKSLASFCHSIRTSRKNPERGGSKLDGDRIAALDAIGFDWRLGNQEDAAKKPPKLEGGATERKYKSFSVRMGELRAYKDKNGHMDVSEKDNKELAIFCRRMRYSRQNPGKSSTKLTQERIDALDKLSFVWGTGQPSRQNITFWDRLAALKAYKEKHGHLLVSQKDDKSLAQWCTHIRTSRNSPGRDGYKLDTARIASLDEIGFDWGSKIKSFDERFDDLKVHKEKQGHFNVSQKDNKQLANFCSNIRQAYKNRGKDGVMRLSDDRIASLDAIGFDWEANNRKSGKRAQKEGLDPAGNEGKALPGVSSYTSQPDVSTRDNDLRSHNEQKGIVTTGNNEVENHDMEVDGSGANHASGDKGKISSGDRVKVKGKTKRKNISFPDRVAALRAFKDIHGHLNVKREQDKSLSEFVRNIRHARKQIGKSGVMKLTQERIASLDDLGFEWVLREESSLSAKPTQKTLTASATVENLPDVSSSISQPGNDALDLIWKQERSSVVHSAVFPLQHEASNNNMEANRPDLKRDENNGHDDVCSTTDPLAFLPSISYETADEGKQQSSTYVMHSAHAVQQQATYMIAHCPDAKMFSATGNAQVKKET